MKKPAHSASRDSTSAFTLIEMLVVIAIIALLTSLIGAGVTGTIQRSYVVKTKSNLRQLYQANIQHAQTYKGYCVPLNSSSEGDWINNKRFQEFLGGPQNGWDDWPSVFKTGTSSANTFYHQPSGVVSKGSIGMNVGWNNNHWVKDQAFTFAQITSRPGMIMFADAPSYTIRGIMAKNGPRVRVEDQNNFGVMTYRYKNKACAMLNKGNVVLLAYSDIFPRSKYQEIWPGNGNGSNDMPTRPFTRY